MQTNCPTCSNRLVVDDAKVPPTPFMLKCPKCQGMVKLPGRNAAAAAAPLAPPPAAAAATPPQARPAPPPPAAPPPSPASAPVRSAPAPPPAAAAQAPGAATPIASGPPAGVPGGNALLALPAAEHASALASALARLGFTVERVEPGDDRLLRLQQGEYALVASSRNGVPDERNAFRFVQMLSPEVRRRVFLVLVGDEFQSGEGIQAFALAADLVIHTKDVPQCERLLAQYIHERRRMYQTYWDAEDRKLEGKL